MLAAAFGAAIAPLWVLAREGALPLAGPFVIYLARLGPILLTPRPDGR